MRALILDGARSIFLEKGFEHVSIRHIAERIQYSPGTIYLYFKDKDEIFHALHEEGFRRMLDRMQPLNYVEDPFERLKALGRVYLQFAKECPDFYDLMFITEDPMKHVEEDDRWDAGSRTLESLKEIVRQCQAKGRFKGMDVDAVSFTIWAGVHGIAALVIRGRCKAFKDIPPEVLVEEGFRIYLKMMENV